MLSATTSDCRSRLSACGRFLAIGFAVVLIGQLAPPLLILWVAERTIRRSPSSHGRFGLSLGLALGVGASLCLLTIPYLGLYPNIPWVILLLLTPWPVDDWRGEVFIHAMNLLAWPAIGWLVFKVGGRCSERPGVSGKVWDRQLDG